MSLIFVIDRSGSVSHLSLDEILQGADKIYTNNPDLDAVELCATLKSQFRLSKNACSFET